MDFYHGTRKADADIIEGPPPNVNVNRGGGELGKGFYVGDNLSLAIAWAKGRHAEPAVLEFQIDNRQYAKLALKQMSHSQVLENWRQLRKMGAKHTQVFKYDVVFGPLATANYAGQYKFESAAAEALLNNSTINRIL